MKFTTSILLPLVIASGAAAKCLDKHRVNRILIRWNGLWVENSKYKTKDVVSNDFLYFYEGDGSVGPVASGPAEMADYVSPSDPLVAFTTSKTLSSFFSCNQIASRWTMSGTLTGNDGNA
jgi:hypothetical protein